MRSDNGGNGWAFVWVRLPSVMQETDQDPGELPVSCVGDETGSFRQEMSLVD